MRSTPVVFLAAQIAAGISAAAFTLGGSLSLIEPQVLASRIVVTTLIRKAVIGMVTHLAESVANQTVTTFLAQFIEFCQKRRAGFDGKQIALATQNGAIGGAVGFGMGNLGGLARTGVGKIAGNKIPVPDVLTKVREGPGARPHQPERHVLRLRRIFPEQETQRDRRRKGRRTATRRCTGDRHTSGRGRHSGPCTGAAELAILDQGPGRPDGPSGAGALTGPAGGSGTSPSSTGGGVGRCQRSLAAWTAAGTVHHASVAVLRQN